MLIPTSQATNEEIIKADSERCEQAYRAALAESGPLPENEVEFLRWRRAVNRRFLKILKRSN